MPALDRRLLKIQFGFLLVVLGGRCNQLAVAWWALQETGSAVVFANMIACSIAAQVLARPLLGWLGDKYNKILILRLVSLTSVLTALLMFLLSATQLFNPWSVGALMLISSAVAGVREPLQSSIIPLFARDDQVSLAVRTKSMLSSISNLLGPAMASALIFSFGTPLAFAVDFIAMLGAAVLIASIPLHLGASAPDEPEPTSSGWRMIYSGFKAVYGVKVEFYLALVAMLVNFALFPFFTILLPLYVKTVIHYPITYLGLLDACFGLGILAGSYTITGWLTQRVPRDLCVAAGFALLGGQYVAGRRALIDSRRAPGVFLWRGGPDADQHSDLCREITGDPQAAPQPDLRHRVLSVRGSQPAGQFRHEWPDRQPRCHPDHHVAGGDGAGVVTAGVPDSRFPHLHACPRHPTQRRLSG
ncbi:MFS transporter [Pseudomonas simiae]